MWPDGTYHGEGGWWRLDPTPGLRDADLNAASWRTQWDQVLDYADFLWSDYVQGMGPERQRQSVYDPLFTSWREQAAYWLDFRLWPRRLAEILVTLRGRLQARPLFYLGMTLLALLMSWLVLKRWGRQLRDGVSLRLASCRDWFRRAKSRSPAGATVPFYARFEELLAQVGRRRPIEDTPREWLSQLADPWDLDDVIQDRTDPAKPMPANRERPTPERFAEASRQIVEGFYRVRYDRAVLDPRELDAIERSLGVVADFLRPARV